MKKPYAFAIFAVSKVPCGDGSLDVYSSTGYVLATSKDEALGKAMRVARKVLPPEFQQPIFSIAPPDLVPIDDPDDAIYS